MSETKVTMCDQCPEDVATYSYAWEWGETGSCGDKGRVLLQQAAQNLNRRIDFHPLATGPRPMELEERANFVGRVYALEHELSAVRERGSALYLETERLRADNRLLLVQKNQLVDEVSSLKSRIQSLVEELSTERRDLATVVEERDVLRTMIGDAERVTRTEEVNN